MTAAIPRTKADELTEQLVALCNAQTPIDEITARRFRREIERSRSVDPYHAAVARGMLAVLEWDRDALLSSFDNALRVRAGYQTYDYFATGLQMIGDFQAATSAALTAVELARTDLSLIRKAIHHAYLDGQFQKAEELCVMYDKLSPSDPHPDHESISDAKGIFEAAGIEERVASECNRLAFGLLREKKITFYSTINESELEDNFLMLRIVVKADQDAVDQLDVELGELLFDNVHGYDPSRYWVGYEALGARK
jgi:hypothetical protein